MVQFHFFLILSCYIKLENWSQMSMCRLVCSFSLALKFAIVSSALSSAGNAAYCALARHLQLVLASSSLAGATARAPAALVGYWWCSPLHTGELRVPKSQGRNCDQTSLNQDWKWKNGPRYINKGDYVAFCWKYISSICRKRKWTYPMSGKSYICANSAFTWFLKVHRIKFSERQTSLGSFCLILECWQIYLNNHYEYHKIMWNRW